MSSPRSGTSNEQTTNSETNATINAITDFRLPQYGFAEPRIWFAVIEPLLEARGIKSQIAKYGMVLAELPPSVLTEISDFIEDPPTEHQFDKLKALLIQRTSLSDEKRIQQLLTGCELGPRKPSQLLRHMRQLIGHHKVDEVVLKQMWLQRLPRNVQQILIISGKSYDLDQLSDMADSIMDVLSDNTISHVASDSATPCHSTPTADTPILAAIADLAARIDKLETNRSDRQVRRRSSQRRSPSRRRSFSRQRSYTSSRDSNICWYHWKFGRHALKCVKPCSFSEANQAQGNASARQ
uniref:DUF7041 domain-containing protein n=1 Tax=Trichobilharzia regenti TaxID=157069 RepID=A0AA85JB25_TRIRE|nr:unnamed protein product [Trichobilharzia regenti]